ncbi:MAG: tetratricopeptide repeat protein, partial [Candidatus Korarchaeota archaeon]|nr:tetratricopeptide repeat protein [Candidatus Korarchaeota archaeon]
EALEYYRELAARDGRFLPDLAMTLNNLGAALADKGRLDEAIERYGEALEIRRELAARDGRFLPDLAGTLNNLGNALARKGRLDEAIERYGEALEILSSAKSMVHVPPVIYLKIAFGLRNLGKLEMADLSVREAIASIDPSADALKNFSDDLAEMAVFLSKENVEGSISLIRDAVSSFLRALAGEPAYEPSPLPPHPLLIYADSRFGLLLARCYGGCERFEIDWEMLREWLRLFSRVMDFHMRYGELLHLVAAAKLVSTSRLGHLLESGIIRDESHLEDPDRLMEDFLSYRVRLGEEFSSFLGGISGSLRRILGGLEGPIVIQSLGLGQYFPLEFVEVDGEPLALRVPVARSLGAEPTYGFSGTSIVFYSLGTRRELKYVPKEVEELSRILGMDEGARVNADELDEGDLLSEVRDAEILHYSGHGGIVEGITHMSSLRVGDKVIDYRFLRRMGRKRRLLAYYNACETGFLLQAPGQVDFYGLIPASLSVGFSAVIAPLLPISDHLAYEHATNFYRFLSQGRSVAEALMLTRRSILGREISTPWGERRVDILDLWSIQLYGNPDASMG